MSIATRAALAMVVVASVQNQGGDPERRMPYTLLLRVGPDVQITGTGPSGTNHVDPASNPTR